MEIVFATSNKKKIEEANSLLFELQGMKIVSLFDKKITEEIPETSDTLEDNAREKAWYIFNNYGYDCFSEDTGLEVDALDGAPGVYSARYAGPEKSDSANISLLLHSLKDTGSNNRKARFRTIICLIISGKEYIFEGKVEGQILKHPIGTGGFGYDPVFMPEGFDHSFAQMDLNTKTSISHRGKAVNKLVEFLRKKYQ